MARSQRLVRKVRRTAGKGVSRFPRVTYALAPAVNGGTTSQNAVKLQASGFAFKPLTTLTKEKARTHMGTGCRGFDAQESTPVLSHARSM